MECVVEVIVTAEAQEQFGKLPLPVQRRVVTVFKRLAAWPAVSASP